MRVHMDLSEPMKTLASGKKYIMARLCPWARPNNKLITYYRFLLVHKMRVKNIQYNTIQACQLLTKNTSLSLVLIFIYSRII